MKLDSHEENFLRVLLWIHVIEISCQNVLLVEGKISSHFITCLHLIYVTQSNICIGNLGGSPQFYFDLL